MAKEASTSNFLEAERDNAFPPIYLAEKGSTWAKAFAHRGERGRRALAPMLQDGPAHLRQFSTAGDGGCAPGGGDLAYTKLRDRGGW